MTNFLLEFYEAISTFDIIYLIFMILSLLKCSRKGFVLSLLAASKWLLAYVITLILFPKVRPFVDGIIDSNYVLDIVLGVGMFILDKIFGFFFGFLRSYVIVVCIFSTISIIYNYDKWPFDFDKSFTFPIVEKGSNYLIKEFPNEKNYDDAKEKVQEL